MRLRRLVAAAVLAAPFFLLPAPGAIAQRDEIKPFGEMRWRSIGPFSGGRTKAVAGIAGAAERAVHRRLQRRRLEERRTTARTWKPIFDDQPTGSIGSVAVAPSNPDVIYVGSGEGLQRPDLSTGDGIYRSADGGKTWTHLGLARRPADSRRSSSTRAIPNRIFVAVLGHPYGPNAERGIFRSTDGGKTFEKVLYKDENTGGSDLEFDPANPDIVYAALWEARPGPVGERRVERPRRRHLQVDRRRHHVAAADEGPRSGERTASSRPTSRSRRATRTGCYAIGRDGARRGHLPIG